MTSCHDESLMTADEGAISARVYLARADMAPGTKKKSLAAKRGLQNPPDLSHIKEEHLGEGPTGSSQRDLLLVGDRSSISRFEKLAANSHFTARNM